jgi:hypothetical protein
VLHGDSVTNHHNLHNESKTDAGPCDQSCSS